MAITIAKTVANVIARGGGAFVSDDAGTTYFDFGRVKSLMLMAEPVNAEADTAGRELQIAVEVTLSGVITQTTDTEILNIKELQAIASNGLWMKFTSVFTNAAGAGAASGYLFKNVLPSFGLEIKFDNTESSITFTAKGRVSVDDFSDLGSTQTLTFDG